MFKENLQKVRNIKTIKSISKNFLQDNKVITVLPIDILTTKIYD